MSVTRALGPVRRALSAGLVVLAGASLVTWGAASRAEAGGHGPLYADIVVDAVSGRVLHEECADEHRHPASLTKVMTLFLLFEELEAGRMQLDTEMPVSKHATRMEPTKLHLKAGKTLTVQDAILGLVTHSANDAAVVIAEALACSEPEFAQMMTAKARELGMHRTTYKNASGLPDVTQVTTARDQAILGRAIQERFPQYFHFFSARSFVWRGARLKNHNNLLGKVDGVDGIKTGYIRMSRFNLLTSVNRDGRRLVVVVMGGQTKYARDAQVEHLIENYIGQAVPVQAWNNTARTETSPNPVDPRPMPPDPRTIRTDVRVIRTGVRPMPDFVNRVPAHGLGAPPAIPPGSKE